MPLLPSRLDIEMYGKASKYADQGLEPCPFHIERIYPKLENGKVVNGWWLAYAECPVCHVGLERAGGSESEAIFALKTDWNTRYKRTCHLENLDGPLPEEVMEMLEVWVCSECGSPIYNDMTPTYCPYCGAKVVDE